MKMVIVAVMLSLALLCAGCGKSALVADIETQAQVDPRVNFQAMKTYAWAGAAGLINDPGQYWVPGELDVAAEIKFLIDSELRKLGYTESTQPEMAVAFLVVNDVKELQAMETERGSGVPDLVGVGEGALLIEVVETRTGRTVWLGAATAKTRTGRSNDDVKKRLNHAVKALFQEFPR